MEWLTNDVFQNILYFVFAFTVLMFFVLSFLDAPYGKHDGDDRSKLWGPNIPLRLSWILLEAPVFFAFAIFFFLGENWLHITPIILFFMWEIHYFHRTFVYPFTLKAKPGAGFRVGILATGIPLNALNGFLNGWYISQYGEHLWTTEWLYDPRFIIGVLTFIGGFALTKQSDDILANLRKPGETGYKIPYGGGFNLVSNPHYLGELLQWVGFAIACWSLPALAFVCITLSNLLPKAFSNHRWYHEKFNDYPKERKSLIPYII